MHSPKDKNREHVVFSDKNVKHDKVASRSINLKNDMYLSSKVACQAFNDLVNQFEKKQIPQSAAHKRASMHQSLSLG